MQAVWHLSSPLVGLVDTPIKALHNKPDFQKLRAYALRESPNMQLAPMRRFHDKYVMDLKLGIPSQTVSLIVDMTSATCFASLDSNIILEQEAAFQQSFNPQFSRTYEPIDALFGCIFADSPMVYGEIGQDYIGIGHSKPYRMQFGLARYYDDQYATCGFGIYNHDDFGPSCSEKSLRKTDFLYQLKAKGAISYKAYSMWLTSSKSDPAAILFGGLDLARLGSLIYRFPMIGLTKGAPVSLAIKLDAINIVNDNRFHVRVAETSLPIRFDINTKISTLPIGILKTYYEALGAQKINGKYSVPCKYMNHEGYYMGLVFSGVEYVFAFPEISEPIDSNKEHCAPGFWPGEPVLGSNILRNLYVVYDLEKYEVGLAQAFAQLLIPPRYHEISTNIPARLAPFYSSSVCNYNYYVHSFWMDRVHAIKNTPWAPLMPLGVQKTELPHNFNPEVLITVTFPGRRP